MQLSHFVPVCMVFASASAYAYPEHVRFCSEVKYIVHVLPAPVQKSATAFCSSYLSIAPSTAVVTATTTSFTTTTLASTTVTVTSTQTGCNSPIPAGPAIVSKRSPKPASSPKPDCLRPFKPGAALSSACKCLSIQPATITSTASTSTVTSTTTVTDGAATTTAWAYQPSGEQDAYILIAVSTDNDQYPSPGSNYGVLQPGGQVDFVGSFQDANTFLADVSAGPRDTRTPNSLAAVDRDSNLFYPGHIDHTDDSPDIQVLFSPYRTISAQDERPQCPVSANFDAQGTCQIQCSTTVVPRMANCLDDSLDGAPSWFLAPACSAGQMQFTNYVISGDYQKK